MTSQKKTPSKRNVELPDWTSEIKPSEDVMALFYAPTGLPKMGAISPIFPINSNTQQEPKPFIPSNNDQIELDNNSTSNLAESKIPLNKALLEEAITTNQDFFHYDKTSNINNQEFHKIETKESILLKTNKVEGLVIPDLKVDLDQPLNQKDQALDQKDQENIPYRNTTQYHSDTVSKSDRVSKNNTVSDNDTVLNNLQPTKLNLSKGFIAIPTFLLDELAKTLTPTEWTLYLRLFRLSYGWHKNTCIVGLEALVEATNIGRTVLRETLKSLQNRKLIQVIETINTKELKGTKYRVYTLTENNTVSKPDRVSKNSTVPLNDTVAVSDTIKYIDDDHDDDLNKDHHQKKSTVTSNLTEHEKAVMMMYKEITGNNWTKADSDNYTKIKNIPIEKIEIALRLANQRAINRPNSFAYFIKEIISVANPKKENRSQQKKIMEKIINNLVNSHIGSSYSISDLSYDTKEACIKEDITFNHDIFDEIVAKKKGK